MSETPMMRQYLAIKEQYEEEILFYRMGDFYEMFFEDAIAGAEILGIALTKRGKHLGNEIPMCGVPAHSYEQYLERLIRSGRKVAICDQIESPEEAKKRGYKEIVRREVTRIITSGTILEENVINCKENNYLCAVSRAGSGVNARFHIAFADLGTKDVFFLECDSNSLANELCKIAPKELLISDKLYTDYKSAAGSKGGAMRLNFKDFEGVISTRPNSIFDKTRCVGRLLKFYEISALQIIEGMCDTSAVALGVLVEYLEHTQKQSLKRLKLPRSVNSSHYVSIDASTINNLEIANNFRAENFTLLNAINNTQTNGGNRLIRTYLTRPLKNKGLIEKRLNNVSFLLKANGFRKLMRKSLPKFPDLERLATKVFYKRAGPRDLKSIQTALEFFEFFCGQVGKLKREFEGLCPILSAALIDCDGFSKLAALLHKAIIPNAPLNTTVGGFIKPQYSRELGSIIEFRDQIDVTLAELKKQYAELSGVNNLKISSNNLVGYYIEVPQNNASKMSPAIFKHKQTLANSIRYTTEELVEIQGKILEITEHISRIELKLFNEICEEVLQHSDKIELASSAIAKFDIYLTAAENAFNNKHVRPEIVEEPVLDICGGRHPIMEVCGVELVNNNLQLNSGDRVWLINGPNMAGKSTFLRQNALIVVLAQMGFFVPAKSAKIGIVDKIFSRIGASDNTARGQSTFMVEMLESSYILNNATNRSLIIFDEVGRGTATYDGLSLAWAILEYIHNTVCARTLFATHYHELKQLIGQLSCLSIHTPKVEEWGQTIVFKYKIEAGSAAGSYGIHVAELAGLPRSVLKRARNVLMQFESDPIFNVQATTSNTVETDAVNDNEKEVLEELKGLDVNNLTPMEAFTLIQKLKQNLA